MWAIKTSDGTEKEVIRDAEGWRYDVIHKPEYRGIRWTDNNRRMAESRIRARLREHHLEAGWYIYKGDGDLRIEFGGREPYLSDTDDWLEAVVRDDLAFAASVGMLDLDWEPGGKIIKGRYRSYSDGNLVSEDTGDVVTIRI